MRSSRSPTASPGRRSHSVVKDRKRDNKWNVRKIKHKNNVNLTRHVASQVVYNVVDNAVVIVVNVN